MKYPCTDGIDRDADLDEYVLVEARLARNRARAFALELAINRDTSQLQRINFNRLGAVGSMQLPAARKALTEAGT